MSTLLEQTSELQLKNLFDEQSRKIAQCNVIQEGILDELNRRHGEKFKQRLNGQGKDGGSITDEISGVSLTYKIDKKITWDQKSLQSILQGRPDLFKSVIEVNFKVPERIYNALTDRAIIPLISAARTLEYKPGRIVFKKDE